MEELTKVYASSDPIKADLVQSYLSKNGVESRLLDRKDSAYVMLGEVAVFVAAKDVEKARKLIEKSEEAKDWSTSVINQMPLKFSTLVSEFFQFYVSL